MADKATGRTRANNSPEETFRIIRDTIISAIDLIINSEFFIQKHFLCTIPAPDSSYSAWVIHMLEKELNPDKIDPPIHTENLLSGGATT